MLNFVSDLAQAGKGIYIASSNILAVNNNPLKDLPEEIFLFYDENNHFRGTCTIREPGPTQFTLQWTFTPTNHVFARAKFTMHGTPGTWEILQHFRAQYK